MNTVPSSSMLMSAPVIAMISLIFFPFGPITSPILSTGIWIVMIRGALELTSSRGAGSAASITSRICSRASFACWSAPARTSAGIPDTFMSSWIAVTNSLVPATLKSMSPSASSAPRMSVRVTNCPSSAIMPIAIPATGALMGTPASISDSVDPHTLAIDVEPFEASTSDTRRRAYGNSSSVGTTGINARSASAPWPISRRRGEPTRPVSPVENGGKL